jgi:hypothetical protein
MFVATFNAGTWMLTENSLGLRSSYITLSNISSFITDSVNGFAGWDSWGVALNKILYTSFETNLFEQYIVNPDGTGKSCVLCGLGGSLATVSKGAGTFNPAGTYILFQGQKASSTHTSLPPGNGTDYNIWLTDYPVVNGPWAVTSANTATLWPQWNKSGTKFSFSEFYNAADSTHPQGYWKVKTYSFAAGNPPATALVSTCEPGQINGLYELGDYFDDNFVWVMNHNSSSDPYHYVGYLMNNSTCALQQMTPNYAAWTEFGRRLNFNSPFMFYSSSKEFPDSTVVALKTEAYVAPATGFAVNGQPGVRITDCNFPGNAWYNGQPTACFIHSISPDGTTALVQVQRSIGGGDPRSIYKATINYGKTIFNGNLQIGSGVVLQ